MVKDRFVKKLWISFGIIIASIVIAAGAFYFFAGAIATQATAVVNERAAVLGQADAFADLASLEGAAPQAAQYESAIDRLLPSQYALVGFGQWFSSEGSQYGVTANATPPQVVTQPQASTPGAASFSFAAEGPLTNLTTFLNAAAAKSSQFLFSFGSLTVMSNGTDYKITGQGTIFFQ